MDNFISTQTAILLSFLLKNMPNLFRHIIECSTEFNVKNSLPKDLSVTILSAKQIQEARIYSNNIVLNALVFKILGYKIMGFVEPFCYLSVIELAQFKASKPI